MEAALERFDGENRADPRKVEYQGKSYSREYLHAVKVHEWVLKLNPQAPPALILASRSNAIRRWEIPRDSYPRTTAGYHRWRKALQKFHAQTAGNILKEEGVEEEVIRNTKALILMENFPADPDTQVLEDADCLTFLEIKFDGYIGQWDESKTVRILKGTLKKMSPAARATALELPLSATARALIGKALTE